MNVRFTNTVIAREGPHISSSPCGTVPSGTVLHCKSSVDGWDGRIWVSFIGNSGNLRWACAEDADGQCYVDSNSRGRI